SRGLGDVYKRQYHESKCKGELLKISIAPGFILLLLTIFVFAWNPEYVSLLLFERESVSVGLLVIFILLFNFILRFLSLVVRMEGRGVGFSLSQLVPKIVILISLLCIYYFWEYFNFEQLLWANFFGFFLTLIIMLFITKKDCLLAITSRVNYFKSKEMIRFGFPLILGSLAFWGVTVMDRMFLRTLSTFEQLAIFSVAVSFASAATIIQSIFSTLWAPMVYKLANNEKESLGLVTKASRYLLFVVVALFCIAGLLSWVVDFFIPEVYGNVKFILLACLGYPLLYTLSETTVVGIGISKKTYYSMLASLFALGINFGLNYILVPCYGAAGAAVSTCMTFWFFLIFRTEFSILCWKKIPRIELYFFTFLCVMGASVEAVYGGEFFVYLKFYWASVLILLMFVNRSYLKGFKVKI
ncbi:lipopolysaccharide biosynthesis protein, partial [Serratia sp. ASV30]|uniref:lipopolysaccharide biosynthesis protein n=1 Tax=Serratia sp. ASV30 TaxID=2795127 RepID=UPI001E5F1744